MSELPPFKENLRAQIKFHGTNQAALAKRVRVTDAAVSRWLKKGHLPNAQDLLALARVLEVDPFKLVGSSFREPEPEAEPVRQGRPPRAEEALAGAAKLPPKAEPVRVVPVRVPPTSAPKKPRQAE